MHMKSIILKRFGLLSSLVLFGISTMFASVSQDFDDIYYNPKKDTAKKVQQTKESKTVVNSSTPTVPNYDRATYQPTPDYAASDTYITNYGSTRDVDEYNRRVPVNDSIATNDTNSDNDEFAYTRRIEKFHNPDVVVNTNDDDLIAYYYETQPQSPSVVNIYVDNSPLWNYTPYYYNSWASSPYYTTWWNPAWSWNWNWNWSFGWYDPWYSWTWGPSFGWNWGWNWGWNPGPHPWWGGWNPGPGHGGWANNWHQTPAGSSRPHNPAAGQGNNLRPTASNTSTPANNPNAGITTRPGASVGSLSGSLSSSERPGSSRGRYNVTSSETPRWPASVNAGSSTNHTVNVAPTTRPAANSSTVSSAPASTRGRTTVTTTPSSSSTVRSSNSSFSTNRSSSSSFNSFSGGASSTRSTGGGSGSSGGGSSRGRR